MRTVAARARMVAGAYFTGAQAQPYRLPQSAVPQSVQVWVNGLRVTDLRLPTGDVVFVDCVRAGDDVVVRYVPAGTA